MNIENKFKWPKDSNAFDNVIDGDYIRESIDKQILESLNKMNIKELYNKIIQNIKEEDFDVFQRVDELKSEYVWDWEDEYDTLDHAYEEMGRGEAESQTLQEIIEEETTELTIDEYCELFDMLKDYWNLNTD